MASFVLNDHPVEIRMDAATPLLWALRDGANLTGTKYGCGTGDCGACLVLVDGGAEFACHLTLAETEGREVTTIEGLTRAGPHPVQQALVAEQAIQCGFCTPGIVVAAVALLRRSPDPGEDEIARSLTNLCRCGVYPRLTRAVRRAAQALKLAAPAPGAASPHV